MWVFILQGDNLNFLEFQLFSETFEINILVNKIADNFQIWNINFFLSPLS
jgi:hypothetical protein